MMKKKRKWLALLMANVLSISLLSAAGIVSEAETSGEGMGIVLNALATVQPSSGVAGTIAPGEKIFADRGHVFGSSLPDWLEGSDYLRSNLVGGVSGVTITKAGWVYVLTPATAQSSTSNNSQVTALEEAGYTHITTLEVGELGATIEEAIAVMGKEVAVNETVSFGQWGVLVTKVVDEKELAGAALEAPNVLFNPTEEEYQDGKRQWQGIPGIAKDDKSGRLWATWYSGGSTEDEYNWSVLYTSNDDGLTWSGPKVVVDPEYPVRSFDPNLWVDPSGRMWFIWNQSYYHFDGRCGVWAMYTDNPGDENPSWSRPMRIANGIAMNDPIVLTNGDWILPTAIWGWSTFTEMGDEINSNAYISKDQGATWSYLGSVFGYTGSRNCDENMIIEQADGTLRMLIRTGYGIEESYSYDGGKTWSDSVLAGISNVASRFYITRLASGSQLMIYNDPPSGANERTHMTAALSFDDGKTWPYKLVIDERSNTTYPDAYQDAEGNIYIIYDHGRTATGEILMAKITEKDIVAGKLVTEGSMLRVLVNDNGTTAAMQAFEVEIAETLAKVESSDGTMELLAQGSILFSDRSYAVGKYAPSQLIGKGYLKAALNSGATVTVTEDGWLYALTPATGDNSKTAKLKELGFTMQATLPQGQLSGELTEELDLLGKEVKAGESYTYDTWAILIGDVDIPVIVLPGDVNGDGAFDVRDVVHLKQYLDNPEAVTIYSDDMGDLDSSGVVDGQDLVLLRKKLINGIGLVERKDSLYGKGITVLPMRRYQGAEYTISEKTVTDGENAGKTYNCIENITKSGWTYLKVSASQEAGLRANTEYQVMVSVVCDGTLPSFYEEHTSPSKGNDFVFGAPGGEITFTVTTDANGTFEKTWSTIYLNVGQGLTYVDFTGITFTEIKKCVYGEGISLFPTKLYQGAEYTISEKTVTDGENAGKTYNSIENITKGGKTRLTVSASQEAGLKANTEYRVVVAVECDGDRPSFFEEHTGGNDFVFGAPGGEISFTIVTDENGEFVKAWDTIWLNGATYVNFTGIELTRSAYAEGVTVDLLKLNGQAWYDISEKTIAEGETIGKRCTRIENITKGGRTRLTISASQEAGLEANTEYQVVVTVECDGDRPSFYETNNVFVFGAPGGEIKFNITTDENGTFEKCWLNSIYLNNGNGLTYVNFTDVEICKVQ